MAWPGGPHPTLTKSLVNSLLRLLVTKATFWTVSKYLLALGVLSYVVYANWKPSDSRGLKGVWDDHVVAGKPIDGIYLLLALALHLTSFVACVSRWYILVRAQDLPFTPLRALRLGALGSLFNAFLPGAVGGDVVRAAGLAQQQSRQTVAIATVAVDRFLSVWGLMLVLALVGSACWAFGTLNDTALAASRVVIVACIVALAVPLGTWFVVGFVSDEIADRVTEVLASVPRVGTSLTELWQTGRLYRNRPGAIVAAVLLTTLSNVCDILTFACYVHLLWDGAATNPLPSVLDHFLLVPVGLVISGVPLFPGGAGIGEAGFGGLYQLFESAPANGVLGSLLFRVSGWVIGIFVYLVCLAIGERDSVASPDPRE